jgi:hypothetical protein
MSLLYDFTGLLKTFFPMPPKRVLPSAVNVGAGAVDYIANCANARNMGTVVLTANVLRAVPFWAPARKSVIGRLAIENTTSAGANNFRVGLYRNVPNRRSFYPGVRLDDSGNFTGAAALQTYATAAELERNILYWMVCNMNASIVVRALDASAVSDLLGIPVGATGTNPHNLYISAASVYGALPSTFPAGGAYVTNVLVPVLRYQFSA